ncbi:hypothetical protein K470DRAFT_255973 [Piedraia hortae CBS 480.64]|uniref:Uncharacterized protein n=1 Tax=Piedraia hortae CBS 480.64 TaxID=1314780 RepID=A0A6A7C5L4_9PEZI|nr:hypothetical protein K470DRAFT_255973 [Piedraia hortae CBS 480.64]
MAATAQTGQSSRLSGDFATIDALADALKPTLSGRTPCELHLSEDSVLPLLRPAVGPYAKGGVHDLPPEYETSPLDIPSAIVSHLLATPTGEPRQIVQRAASRAIVRAIETTDGFRYVFNNVWAAMNEEGLRFSYICQDSVQNKERHRNKAFSESPQGGNGRKPTFDCKGCISIKFSQTRRRIDVNYRHLPIHDAVPGMRISHMQVATSHKSRSVSGSPSQRPLSLAALLEQSGDSSLEDIFPSPFPDQQPLRSSRITPVDYALPSWYVVSPEPPDYSMQSTYTTPPQYTQLTTPRIPHGPGPGSPHDVPDRRPQGLFCTLKNVKR